MKSEGRYKVVWTDGYASETIRERLLCENQGFREATAICERLRNESNYEGDWYIVKRQYERLWLGMEEFVDNEAPQDEIKGIWMVARNLTEAAADLFCDGPTPNWRELRYYIAEGNVLVAKAPRTGKLLGWWLKENRDLVPLAVPPAAPD